MSQKNICVYMSVYNPDNNNEQILFSDWQVFFKVFGVLPQKVSYVFENLMYVNTELTIIFIIKSWLSKSHQYN
jgi:hypothetical protein